VHPRAGVDSLLPVVRQVVNKTADHGVGLQARRGQRVVKDLGRGGLLEQQLAAPASPLAADLALHKELGRHDVQALADVLAHAHHRLTALWRWAVGVRGLHAQVHPGQVWRQCFTLGLAAWLLVWCAAVFAGGALQDGQLRLQAGLISGQRLLEERALLGVHAFGPGAKLPSLQARQLKRDALDLRIAPLDGLGLRVQALALFANVFALLPNMGQQLCRNFGPFTGVQSRKILGFQCMQIEHALTMQHLNISGYWGMFQLHF